MSRNWPITSGRCPTRWTRCGGSFDVPGRQRELESLEKQLNDPDIWSESDRVRVLQQRRSRVSERIEKADRLSSLLDDAETLLELVREGEDAVNDLAEAVRELAGAVERTELETLLSGKHDSGDAILEIHPGAGGTESQDWAEMLLRMYVRWAEASGFKVTTLDHQTGDEAGIKSVTLEIRGASAYGYLQVERGVHRLVRISPFDAQSRRHTSFASVEVIPVISDDVEVVIDEKDVRIDTYRSSGAGGQHVNKTDSAVRITHQPSGIVVTCQNERSQHRNKDVAMQILRAKLYDRARQEAEEKMARELGDKKKIEWGSQIRSYVLAPYRLVKDHRTSHEMGDADRVLDGDLDGFIRAALFWRRGEGADKGA